MPAENSSRTGWLSHERYFWHNTGTAAGSVASGEWLEPLSHFESAASKRRLQNLLAVSGLLEDLVHLEPRAAGDEELRAVHTDSYLGRIEVLSSDRGGDAGDGATPFGRGGADIARLAAGGAVVAVEAVARGALDTVYALVRPPGHHATPDRGMGFCIFNNVAVAVRAAQRSVGVQRVAVVDWDVHHGNGTQAIFYEDPTVLVISVHQDNWYPVGSGACEESGGGSARGTNINVPLPAGSGHGAYVDAFGRVVIPALRIFGPDLLVVSCGFDAAGYDPLGRMLLHSDSYRRLTEMLLEFSGGRLAVIHEGGYSEMYVPFCGLAVLETLAGRRTPVEDPYLVALGSVAGQLTTGEQRRAIETAEALITQMPGAGEP
jgi:acetoin utilization deacetylase AcuC-like enzyme